MNDHDGLWPWCLPDDGVGPVAFGSRRGAIMDESTCEVCGGAVSVTSAQDLCSACLAVQGLQSNTFARNARRRGDWQPPSSDEIAAHFGELDQIKLAGRGGMGAVYSARQKQLDRTVALKVLPTQLLHDVAFAERFAREAQALAKLNHPNIVTIHDFGRRSELYFFIMEYVDGPTLRQIIATRRTQPEQALAIIGQICDALQFAHEKGIIHRDIKPENILINQRGQVKIADFGLAKLMAAEMTAVPILATTSIVGTPSYMAPEQIDSPHSVDGRADVYSIGVVLYELLTGELPAGDLETPLPAPSLAAGLGELINRAMSPERTSRFESVAQFRTLLQSIPASELDAAPLPPVVRSGRSSIQKHVIRDVRAAIAVPARGIKYVAIANIAFLFLTTVPALLSYISAAPEKVIDSPLGLHLSLPWWATGAFLFTMLSIVLNAIIVLGSNRMRDLRGYGWSLAAAILCLFAAPANVIGAVFGVWAIIILTRAQTRQAFGVSRVQFDALKPPVRGGIAVWLPMVRIHRGQKVADLANYTLLASTLWLISYALISEFLLGRPMGWVYACLLVLPAFAVPQSMFRVQRRLPPARMAETRHLSLKPIPLVARAAAFTAALLLYATTNQSLTIRQFAEQRAASTQPIKPSMADRLHITVPKVKVK